MFNTGGSTIWFQLFAFVVCAALLAFAVMTFVRAERKATPAAWWSGVGAVLFLVVGIFAFYLSDTAGTEPPRPLQTEGMTELNKQAPPVPTPVEIKKDSQERTNQAFGETTKSVEEHQAEADKAIDRALERSRKNNP